MWFRTVEKVGEMETERAIRFMLYDGMCSQVLAVLAAQTFLVAFALQLGATNKVVGIMAAISPLAQFLQIPAVLLVDHLRRRKALVVAALVSARMLWFVLAALPWLLPPERRIPALLTILGACYAIGAFSNCAWNSWMRDLVPERMMGAVFSKRLAVATALGAVLSLVAGSLTDYYTKHGVPSLTLYAGVIGLGAVFGVTGTCFVARIPEPTMKPTVREGLRQMLLLPFKDRNYRMLLTFLGGWNFAVNLAAPFFIVYMLRVLGFSMGWIVGLSVLSQAMNVLFFRVWGRLSDRFSNKSCLLVSGTLFVIGLAVWPFTTMPERFVLTVPLVILIHVLSGVSTAGVALCSSNIAMKCAPKGQATAFLAVNAMVCGAAAVVAPVLAGSMVDWLEGHRLRVLLTWLAGTKEYTLPAVDFRGLDFLFMGAAVLGLYGLHRLLAVREEGEVEEEIVRERLWFEVRRMLRNISTVAGLRYLTHFPYMLLRNLAEDTVAEHDSGPAESSHSGEGGEATSAVDGTTDRPATENGKSE